MYSIDWLNGYRNIVVGDKTSVLALAAIFEKAGILFDVAHVLDGRIPQKTLGVTGYRCWGDPAGDEQEID